LPSTKSPLRPHAAERDACGQLGVANALRRPERLALNHRLGDDASGHVTVPSINKIINETRVSEEIMRRRNNKQPSGTRLLKINGFGRDASIRFNSIKVKAA